MAFSVVSQRGFWKASLYTLVVAGLACTGGVGRSDAAQEHKFATEPFQHVAHRLQDEKVVALADFAHVNAYPFQTVIRVLNHWLDDPNRAGHCLTLGLEADTATAEMAQEYMTRGDLEPVLEHLLPFSSLEQLEFYHDLRLFHLKLEESNSKLQPGQRVRFQIAGFEPASLFSISTDPEYQDVSTMQAALKDRDKTIAENVLKYLNGHPSDQLLLFYGMDHLKKRPSRTSYLDRLFGGGQEFQYMAHHLASKLGDDFLSVAQISYPRELRSPGHPDRSLTEKDLFFQSTDIPWKLTRINPADFDSVIFLHPAQIDEPHYLRFICSRRVIEQAIGKIALLEESLPLPLAQTYYQRAQESLQFITGQSFEDPNEWRQWLQTHSYDGLQHLESTGFAEQVFSIYNTPASQSRVVQLMSLGLPAAYANTARRLSKDQWFDQVWPKLLPAVKFVNCIGIYWLGHPDEQKRAKRILVEFTNRDFDDPALYLKWYRQQYLHLDY